MRAFCKNIHIFIARFFSCLFFSGGSFRVSVLFFFFCRSVIITLCSYRRVPSSGFSCYYGMYVRVVFCVLHFGFASGFLFFLFFFLCVLGGLPLPGLLFSCDVQLGVHVLAKYMIGKICVLSFSTRCFFVMLSRAGGTEGGMGRDRLGWGRMAWFCVLSVLFLCFSRFKYHPEAKTCSAPICVPHIHT